MARLHYRVGKLAEKLATEGRFDGTIAWSGMTS
jgi:hypothetical protein